MAHPERRLSTDCEGVLARMPRRSTGRSVKAPLSKEVRMARTITRWEPFGEIAEMRSLPLQETKP